MPDQSPADSTQKQAAILPDGSVVPDAPTEKIPEPRRKMKPTIQPVINADSEPNAEADDAAAIAEIAATDTKATEAKPKEADPVVSKTPDAKSLVSFDDAPPKAEKPADAVGDDFVLEVPKDTLVSKYEIKNLENYAKASGLNKVQAQELLNARSKSLTGEVTRIANEWYDQVEKDPVLGGANLERTKSNAKAVLLATATPEQRQRITKSAMANNPDFLSILNNMAKFLPQEDKVHATTPTPKREMPRTMAEAIDVFYR